MHQIVGPLDLRINPGHPAHGAGQAYRRGDGYLRDLRYHLTEDDLAGLKLFLELSVEGFDWNTLEFWGERTPAAV